jgi:PIN domain nuclease of toxin-antitoxin system
MKLLLDTPLLLWAAGEPGRLSTSARHLLGDARHELWFSAASLWEITIKAQLGRADFIVAPRVLRRGLLDNGYRELAVTSEHAVQVEGMPELHREPFDRRLVAQAQCEGITLRTADATVARYPGPVRLV